MTLSVKLSFFVHNYWQINTFVIIYKHNTEHINKNIYKEVNYNMIQMQCDYAEGVHPDIKKNDGNK